MRYDGGEGQNPSGFTDAELGLNPDGTVECHRCETSVDPDAGEAGAITDLRPGYERVLWLCKDCWMAAGMALLGGGGGGP